uniref:Uncharacterized protein n=1 Tax=Arundo donax TaxID=35708 RepID=A0A0A9H1M7_ARUDO
MIYLHTHDLSSKQQGIKNTPRENREAFLLPSDIAYASSR